MTLVSTPPISSSRTDSTRERLREAAFARFEAQGFDGTSVAEIASDAGVSERTFYRYFQAKEYVLFADYERELHWFRIALQVRPRDEPISTAVLNASAAFPHQETLYDLARLRGHDVDPVLLHDHLRRIEGVFAEEIESHLHARAGDRSADDVLRIRITSRSIAGAFFAALETWLALPEQSLDELGRLVDIALELIAEGVR